MISVRQPRICGLVSLVALCGLGGGCVATSDLERLNRDLTQKMEVANASLQDDLTALGGKVDQVQTSQEALRSGLTTAMDSLRTDTRQGLEQLAGDDQQRRQQLTELEAQLAKTRQALTEYVRTNSQALEQIAQATQDVNQKLAAIEQTVAAVQGLPAAVSALGSKLRGLRETLQQTYKLEEAALRHRLKALEELTRQLEPHDKQAKKSE